MIDRLWKLFLIFILIFSFQYDVIANDTVSEKKNETDKLSPEQKAFLRDMKLIQQMMLQEQIQNRSQIDVRGVEFDLGDVPVNGSESAQLIIVEFSDYSCNFCGRYAREIYPEIYRNYISTGKIRYTLIDYPLPDDYISVKAVEAAYCAGDQGKFWEMHSAIMHDQKSLNDLTSIASFIDLDLNKFEKCLETKNYNSRVIKNISLASRLEIPSVPGFIIALIDPDNPDKAKGISYIRGAKPFEVFQQEIDKALAELD